MTDTNPEKEHDDFAEVNRIGQNVFESGIEMANQLLKYIPERCETIEVKKHYEKSQASVNNGGIVGTVNTEGVEFSTGGHWSVIVYQERAYLQQAITT